MIELSGTVLEEMMDEDGYPTEAALLRISGWPLVEMKERGFLPVMAFVRSLWHYADWGFREKKTGNSVEFDISTGGWSGNESLIAALQGNHIFWSVCWVQSRRGGHYIFIVPDELAETKKGKKHGP